MKTRHFFLGILLSAFFAQAKAQSAIKLDYFGKVPAHFKDCGVLYTYDSVALAKKQFMLVVDLQNQCLLAVGGKQVKLTLTDAKTVRQTNIATYIGGGYTLIVSTTTLAKKGKIEIETGTLQISNGANKMTTKIHGQSSCDESKQEGNS
ncbi:MAG: hypothetical protein ABIX01_21520 [Chitinophagaceae bacterium]